GESIGCIPPEAPSGCRSLRLMQHAWLCDDDALTAASPSGGEATWSLPGLPSAHCRYPDRMRHQRLRSVVVEGLTSIRSAALELNDVNVLVGANGAGKSNFIRALSVLGRIVDSELGLFVGLSGGANALLNVSEPASRRIHLEVESTAG